MILENFCQDIRVGARVLLKDRGFCALAVLVLALGIAGVTTQFSVVNGSLLRGFSFPNADRLAGIQIIDPTRATGNGFDSQIFSLDYEEIRIEQQSFDLLAADISGATVNLTIGSQPRRLTGAYVTEDYFRVLGIEPVLGRNFSAADNQPGAEKVVLISDKLWQREFHGAPDVIDQALRVNGKAARIIGVMPPGFSFPGTEEIWLPLHSEYSPKPRTDTNAPGNQVGVIGLIKQGVSYEQANSEFTTFAKRLAETYPDTNKRFVKAVISPLITSFVPRNIQGLLWVMLAFCAGLLLIACFNVMNMQFARAALRAKELAVRSSLGATRLRLIRQMLTESLLLASIGALVGIGVAAWATDYLDKAVHNQDNPIPAYITFTIDGPVLAFVVIATMASAVVSGLVPAWLASRTNAIDTLKEGGRGNSSRTVNIVTRILVILQITVTCVLLIGSLLQAQSIVRQQQIDYGYDTRSVLTARMALMEGDYPTPEAKQLFFQRLTREIRSSPEFDGVALTNRQRMAFTNVGPATIEIEGGMYRTDTDRITTSMENVSDGYFETLGMKIREGRDFTIEDSDARQPVAVVLAGFARKHFGNQSALGRRFRIVTNNGELFGPWRTIVGVVEDVRLLPPFNIPNVDNTGFYLPFFAAPFGPATETPFAHQFATIVVRPRGGVAPESLATSLQREVNRVDPNLPLYFVGTAKRMLDSFIAQNRTIAAMFTLFGVVAMFLASVGLYGVVSFSVAQRTSEFGIRMALGADPRRIMRMVLGQGARQVAIGVGAGLALTASLALLGRASIAQLLFDVDPLDPRVYLGVTVLLATVAAIATLVPARRATKVDPLDALRAE